MSLNFNVTMVLMDIMKKVLNSFVLLLSVAVLLAPVSYVHANGKSDPLSIVSDAERIAPDPVQSVIVENVVEVSDEDAVDPYIRSEDGSLNVRSGNTFSSAYVIGPSDKLRVTVYGEKDLSKVYQVDGLGMVSVPLIGQIKVAGMTLRQAEAILIVALSNGYLVDPSVAIEVAEFRPFYIMGEIRRPGSYNYIDGMSVLNAVAISGGFTYRANTKNIEVVRSGVNGDKVKVTPTAQVMPGDIIRVKERFF